MSLECMLLTYVETEYHVYPHLHQMFIFYILDTETFYDHPPFSCCPVWRVWLERGRRAEIKFLGDWRQARGPPLLQGCLAFASKYFVVLLRGF